MSETPRPDWTEHDAKLAALYRTAALDEPRPALDHAIRAAARRAVASKPRVAGLPFSRSWRVPLSIAAVVLLSVSLVTVMREEAPEVALPPRADTPPPDKDRKLAESAPAAGESNTAVPQTLLPGDQKPKSVGLKPPQQGQSTGIGIHGYTVSPEPATESKKEMAAADRLESGAPSAPLFAKRAAPEAFPGTAGRHEDKVTTTAGKLRQSAKEGVRRDVGVSVEAQQRLEAVKPLRSPAETGASTPGLVATPAADSARAAGAATEGKAHLRPETDSVTRESSRAHVQAAPVAKPLALPPASQMAGTVQAYADLPPAKWLERIEELRKRGKFEEAKTSLAEFKQRYPDYPLPASLKVWARP
jgi:hypothetical protein